MTAAATAIVTAGNPSPARGGSHTPDLGSPCAASGQVLAEVDHFWTVGYPRADRLARLQVHFVQELDDCDDAERADDLRRKQFLYQLRLLRGLPDFLWYFYLEEGTLGACAWGLVGLGHVFGRLRRRVTGVRELIRRD